MPALLSSGNVKSFILVFDGFFIGSHGKDPICIGKLKVPLFAIFGWAVYIQMENRKLDSII